MRDLFEQFVIVVILFAIFFIGYKLGAKSEFVKTQENKTKDFTNGPYYISGNKVLNENFELKDSLIFYNCVVCMYLKSDGKIISWTYEKKYNKN